MITLELKGGGTYSPEASDVDAWKVAYKNIDVEAELNQAAIWHDANPAKRKVKGKAFLTNWLKRANDKGGSPYTRSSPGSVPTRSMSTTDELAHNFLGCPEIRKAFIAKFGYSFENGKRLTS